MLKAVFIKEPEPKELVRKWQADLRKETRNMERQIRDIQFEEKKIQRSIKDAAKRNDMGSAKHLAKEVVQSRRVVSRLYLNRAHLMDVGNSLNLQLAQIKVAGAMAKSTEVMKSIMTLVKIPELQANMMEMSKEMTRAGLIEEMVNESLDSAMDAEDMEEETEEEINKVLAELANDTRAALPFVKKGKVPQAEKFAQKEEEEEEQTVNDMDALQARLDAMRS